MILHKSVRSYICGQSKDTAHSGANVDLKLVPSSQIAMLYKIDPLDLSRLT